MNENLRRALLRARLTDEDVATRLEVDPKTVRRWLEGRLPYLRHRWALASMLDLDEIDLWPQARVASSRHPEVQTVYPHRSDVPAEAWKEFFGCARREIGILADTAFSLVTDPEILATLTSRAQAGVQEHICLRDPGWPTPNGGADRGHYALPQYRTLLDSHNVQIRLHRALLSNVIYRSDHHLLISQRVFGVPACQAPVLYLQQIDGEDMATTYLNSFNGVWASAQPVGET